MAQMVKNLPAMQETQIRFLGQEDPLEKGMVTHSSILAWRIPWTEESTVHDIAESDTNERLTHTHTHTHTHIPESLRCLKTQIDNFNLVIYGAL